MSEAEKEVLKTFKSGLGLTNAEREILVNYIEKLQKVIDLMAEYLNENNREFWTDDIEETKQYFYKKVEEEK